MIARGHDILAAVSPLGCSGRTFDLLSGTSMSSPHMAGLAALLKGARPGWSPMAIKSALMTAAGDLLDGANIDPLVIFRPGAGHDRPLAATDPGPVFESSNLHGASIAIGDLAGVRKVKRRVTNVSGNPATLTASAAGLVGFIVGLPGPVTLAAGQTEEIEFTFTRAAAALNGCTRGPGHPDRQRRPRGTPAHGRPAGRAGSARGTSAEEVNFRYRAGRSPERPGAIRGCLALCRVGRRSARWRLRRSRSAQGDRHCSSGAMRPCTRGPLWQRTRMHR